MRPAWRASLSAGASSVLVYGNLDSWHSPPPPGKNTELEELRREKETSVKVGEVRADADGSRFNVAVFFPSLVLESVSLLFLLLFFFLCFGCLACQRQMKLLGQLHISFALWTYLTQESKKFLLLQLDPYGKRCDQNTRRQSSCFTFHSSALMYPKSTVFFLKNLLFICFISSKNNLWYIFFLLQCSYSDVSHTLHFFNPVMVQRSKNQTASWGMQQQRGHISAWDCGRCVLIVERFKVYCLLCSLSSQQTLHAFVGPFSSYICCWLSLLSNRRC